MRKVNISQVLIAILFAGPLAALESPAEKKEQQILTFSNGNKLILTNINPFINRWYILEASNGETLHLENTDARYRVSLLEPDVEQKAERSFQICKLWDDNGKIIRDRAAEAAHRLAYFPICNGKLFIRLPKPSNTRVTLTERGTELLRKTPFGEDIINYFKPFLVEMKAEKADLAPSNIKMQDVGDEKMFPPAILTKNAPGEEPFVRHSQLGIAIEKNEPQVRMGHWYKSSLQPGVFVSLFSNNQVTTEILNSFPERVSRLEKDELETLSYEIAYDLDMYSVNYSIGTNQPEIKIENSGWSPEKSKYNQAIVPIGSMPPYRLGDGIGVFAGGFKNRHGIVKAGPHAGKKYGYIESGVELEAMSPGLATVLVDTDGEVDILAWPDENHMQEKLREVTVGARQNGLFLMKDGEPGEYVHHQDNGGWWGDKDYVFKSLRSGICISQNESGKRFLTFFAFTRATPSALARTMQAYQCRTAMQLDMNFHIYMYHALYKILADKSIEKQFLHRDMNYDHESGAHRFITDNNNRDFFYIYRKSRKDERVKPQ